MTRRLFVAIEVPPECRDLARRARTRIADAAPDVRVRWQPEENLHLTLAFLGNVPEAEVEPTLDRLQQIASHGRPFQLTTSTLGAFPSPRRPSVLWLGAKAAPEAHLTRLQRDVALSFAHRIDDRKPFRPHLTLGRVKGSAGVGRTALAEALAQVPAPRVTWRVEELVLFESTLSSDGAIHVRLGAGTIPA